MRESYVTNLYLENYNIPFLVYNSGLASRKIERYTCSKDIPATLCKIAYGEVPEEFKGHAVIDDYVYENGFIEYCGGGCPDLRRRQLKIAAFDEKWFVGTLCFLDETFDASKVTEIYNLEKDPLQRKNLRLEECCNEHVDHLINCIYGRIVRLKSDNS